MTTTLLERTGRAHADSASTDTIERRLVELESLIGAARCEQARLLIEIDQRQVPAADGCRSIDEWIVGRLDVTRETASGLRSMSRSRWSGIEGLSFDKAVAVVALAGVAGRTVAEEVAREFDVAGILRLTARHRRLTRLAEAEVFDQRHLIMQPALDQSHWRIWGVLPGIDGSVVEKALCVRADSFPSPPEDRCPSTGERMADALTSVCQDSLSAEPSDDAGPSITVFVDAGAVVSGSVGCSGGPDLGPSVLEELVCTGKVSVVATDGMRPVSTSRASRAIPGAIRRFVSHRDGGRCTADGCSSRYRLQPHHIVPWAAGGFHDPTNLTTLCWFHHHVVIHGMGYRIDPGSPTHRRRFINPASGTDPP